MTRLTVGALFSGVGGLELGLERAGMRVVWNSEIDPYCRRILAKHWADVPNLGDVTTIDWGEVPRVDLICGGYPCQPFSYAGSRGGHDDERHLWPFMLDAVRVLRPRYVLVENVPGHLSLGLDRVLADFAGIGFDAEWSLVSACSLGAPHVRQRVFVLAYPAGSHVPNPMPHRGWQAQPHESRRGRGGTWRPAWLPEPAVDRVAVGLPFGMVRDPLHALGNAVVPQVAEHIGRLIVEAAA